MPDDVARYFDALAKSYSESFRTNELANLARRRAQDLYREQLDLRTVLDLGCGAGDDAAFFARLGCDVVAVDASPAMVVEANLQAARAGCSDRVHVVQADIRELGDKDLQFVEFDSVVLAFGVVNCCGDVGEIMRPAISRLRRGGRLMVSALNRWCVGDLVLEAVHGRASERWRRQPRRVSLGHCVTNAWYWSARDIVRAAPHELARVHMAAVGWLLPPAYADTWFRKLPRVVKESLAELDKSLAERAGAVVAADMVWITFERIH